MKGLNPNMLTEGASSLSARLTNWFYSFVVIFKFINLIKFAGLVGLLVVNLLWPHDAAAVLFPQ